MNADRLSSLDAEHIELHITAAAAAGPARALNPQHRVTQLILDQESETRTLGGGWHTESGIGRGSPNYL